MNIEQWTLDSIYCFFITLYIICLLILYTVESQILDKSNSRCLEQKNRSNAYQFTQNNYSISRTLDVSNKFVGPLRVRDIES